MFIEAKNVLNKKKVAEENETRILCPEHFFSSLTVFGIIKRKRGNAPKLSRYL
jgi:hypothetical protein